ncbi:MAG TPA: multicopper oxidase domain-containing protein [Thermoanaerobaculia bacterium]|nr:multicopper oxidase domain-containing protein [Thermoanaerobaculia bacterium]
MTAKKLKTPFLWLSLILLGATGAARAQDSTQTCPISVGEELRKVTELRPGRDGQLSTTFTVEVKRQCVPVQSGTSYVGNWMDLRTYVYPDPETGKLRWGFPGPTLRVRKPDAPGKLGNSWAILLVNNLPPDGGNTCDSACPQNTDCSDPLPDPTKCPGNNDPKCCCWVDRNQTFPDCFHGDNTTNLHFHGSHVSPQAPQDYVLLELRPKPKAGAKADDGHPVHRGGVVAYGQYQYKVDPLIYDQAEGTHWYHPHKHGSVSLQVANGMPGALVIEGPFDDQLNGYYARKGQKLEEKLMVLQQIQQDTNLFQDKAAAPPTLVNGQVSPKITMRPGEVQRWRFVNATMQVAAQLSIYFPQGSTAKQIAMDGVQFAPENYQRQPLFDPSNPSKFTISPGNRADFLVQAPSQPGTYHLTHEVTTPTSVRTRQRLQARDEALAPGDRVAPLVQLVVEEAKEKVEGLASGFPPVSEYPKMPPFLQDIPLAKVKGKQDLTFNMADKQGNPAGPGNPATMFFINNVQYDSDCVNVTTILDTADDWLVKNTSVLAHPFHIHTNPFQVIAMSTQKFEPPYVWQDTIALPVQAKPTDPAGWVRLRHLYRNFTGEYVLHCHFLGHEDRGMMFGVQTVCPEMRPEVFGKALTGYKKECVAGNLIPAAPRCSTGQTTTSASSSGHSH